MKILLLGGGGREHALSYYMAQSPACDQLFIAPGNAGTDRCGQNIKLNINDFEEVKNFVIQKQIDFVVVGPEDPIVHGISDYFASTELIKNVQILAPSKAAAQLEGSKNFAKEFMQKNNIPTARFKSFNAAQYNEARDYLSSHPLPIVVKADGLAAGKGVIICHSVQEAHHAIDELFLKNKFGKAGERVVIEEFMDGIELSVFVLTDGNHYVLFPSAKDYKRIGDGDTGLNTGGMGCVSPPPFVDDRFMEKVVRSIIEPTMLGLQKDHMPYKGFIFLGLMNMGGDPYMIEYNVRLGDPETEVILPRINEDFLTLIYHAAKGTLKNRQVSIKKEFAVTVMLVSGGYPEEYEKDKLINGLDLANDSIIFQAGTMLKDDLVYTSGGRVLSITSLDMNLGKALAKSYQLAEKISFEKKYYRRDIGKDLLKYL